MPEVITIPPSAKKMNPIEAPIPKRGACLIIKVNAFQADGQKFLLVSAIWMYAFLLINLMNFSRQYKQLENKQFRILTQGRV